MTNRELITAALRMIGVLDADETAPSPEDGALALGELNNLMTDLAAEGIDLGYPPQDNLSDDFPLDDQVAGQVKPVLAVYLQTFYPSAQPSPMLPMRADRAKSQLLRDAVLSNIQEADMSNLPPGESRWGRGNILDG